MRFLNAPKPMTLLRFDDISLDFGEQKILADADFSIEAGERVCLIGRNGAGKSTTLRLITGEIEADRGEIVRKTDLVVSQLEQTLPEAKDLTVDEVVRSGLRDTEALLADYRRRSATDLDEEGLALLARIRRSATRATDLLADLLQMSRAGRTELRFEPIDMTALARESFAHVRAAEDADGPEVELVVDPLPEGVGDRALLGDVFCNLLGNALKYTRDREKRRIHVSGEVEDDACVYHVADNGIGFDMRFDEKIFRLFERLHHEDEVEGTGVGLAIVARIVRRHGGGVRAEGTPGEGARFSFTLPRREAA